MTNPSTGYPHGYLIYLIKQMEMGMKRPLEDLILRHGISLAGYTALAVLQNRPGITSSELARRSFVRAQTMAETVTGLTETGLVRREKDPVHGRRILLYITDRGLERVAALAPDVTRLESQVVQTLGEGESAELVRALRACRDALAGIPREEHHSTSD